DRMRASGAIPITPSRPPGPWPCPAISDAIAVPCRRAGVIPASTSFSMFGPVVTDPRRSAWFASTPESTTATVTPLPLVISQAASTPSARSMGRCRSRTSSACAGTGASHAPASAAARTAAPARTAARRPPRVVLACVIALPPASAPPGSAPRRSAPGPAPGSALPLGPGAVGYPLGRQRPRDGVPDLRRQRERLARPLLLDRRGGAAVGVARRRQHHVRAAAVDGSVLPGLVGEPGRRGAGERRRAQGG